MRPVSKLNESEGIPYIKMVLSGLLTDVLSGNSETVAGLSMTEFLQENSKRANEHIVNTFNRESIYFILVY
jgi:hypothetical protein